MGVADDAVDVHEDGAGLLRAQMLCEAPYMRMSPVHDRRDRLRIAALGRSDELFTGPATVHAAHLLDDLPERPVSVARGISRCFVSVGLS